MNEHLSQLKNFLFPLSFDRYRMDAYMVRLYPEIHEKYMHTRSDTLYWLHHFLKTKPDKRNKSNTKGFIKIEFRYEG